MHLKKLRLDAGSNLPAILMLGLVVALGRCAFSLPAPIPSPIFSAKAVMLTNGGEDQLSLTAFNQAGNPNLLYDDFYASLQSWGRYSMVTSPEQADLIIEVSVAAPLGVGQVANPGMTVRIYDAKAHVLLWSFLVPIDQAFRKATFEKNIHQAADAGVKQLKSLAENSNH